MLPFSSFALTHEPRQVLALPRPPMPQPQLQRPATIPAVQPTRLLRAFVSSTRACSSSRYEAYHNWSRDQSTCVVIPLEAINTLDLLKKGDEPINLAARKATRWLEDKIAVSPQDGDAMLTQPAPGIFAQKEHFRVSSTRMAKARQARMDHHPTHPTDQDDDGAIVKDQFNASEAPRYLHELLSVCLYCQEAATAASNYAVAIAYPPHHLDETMIEAQAAANDKPTYLNRTDGRATEAWLDAYQIPFEVVPTSKTWTGEKASSRFRGELLGDQHGVGSADEPVGSMSSGKGQLRRRASPTPSVSSSTSSFKSELSGFSMLGSHKSPRLRPESRFAATTAPLRSVRCMSTSAAVATASWSTDAAPNLVHCQDSIDQDGPIIARPSSAASSHTSSVSCLTTSTQDDWSGSSHCGARVVRHASSPAPMDASTAAAMNADSLGTASPRLTSRTLHKTKSGAEKMEEYLRRLEASAGGADRRMDSSTPTPRNG